MTLQMYIDQLVGLQLDLREHWYTSCDFFFCLSTPAVPVSNFKSQSNAGQDASIRMCRGMSIPEAHILGVKPLQSQSAKRLPAEEIQQHHQG